MIQNKGLLVIDPQDEFINRAPHTQAVGARLCELLDEALFPTTVITRFRNAPNSPHQTILGWHKMTNQEECELWKPIQDRAREIPVVDKHSYTSATAEILSELQQGDTVFIAGLDTDCCVLTTAVDLFQRSIRPIVLADFCSSGGGEVAHEAGLQCLQRLIGPKNIFRDAATPAQLRERLRRESLLIDATEPPRTGANLESTAPLEMRYRDTALDVVLRNIWSDLAAGAADSAHQFHISSLATSGTSSRPTQRSVLLRGCSIERGTLTFYTDNRTRKIHDINQNPHVSLCFYNPSSGVQVTAFGRAELRNQDSLSQAVLAKLPKREFPRYLAETPPGTSQAAPTSGLPRDVHTMALTDELHRKVFENFTVVEVAVERLDWFISQDRSCLRAQFERQGTTWHGSWVTP